MAMWSSGSQARSDNNVISSSGSVDLLMRSSKRTKVSRTTRGFSTLAHGSIEPPPLDENGGFIRVLNG